MSLSSLAISDLVRSYREAPDRSPKMREYAKSIGTTPQNFSQTFSRITGVSPSKFVMMIKIERSKNLLIHTKLSITEISQCCGYDSFGSFSRTFTSLVGISPRQFRILAPGWKIDADQLTSMGMRDEIPAFVGTVSNPSPDCAMVVAIGLFTSATPAGKPLGGQLLLGGGRFMLPPVRAMRPLYLLGFAIPLQASLWHIPNTEDVFIFSHKIKYIQSEICECEPHWRRPTIFDPPIVFALPTLLM